jgi:hypothetical protein
LDKALEGDTPERGPGVSPGAGISVAYNTPLSASTTTREGLNCIVNNHDVVNCIVTNHVFVDRIISK